MEIDGNTFRLVMRVLPDDERSDGLPGDVWRCDETREHVLVLGNGEVVRGYPSPGEIYEGVLRLRAERDWLGFDEDGLKRVLGFK